MVTLPSFLHRTFPSELYLTLGVCVLVLVLVSSLFFYSCIPFYLFMAVVKLLIAGYVHTYRVHTVCYREVCSEKSFFLLIDIDITS